MNSDFELDRILDELTHNKVLSLSMVRRLSTLLPGEYPSTHLGKGLEFHDVRPYRPLEDGISSIDPMLSRRLGKPMSRIFVEERELEVFILVDISENMLWGGERAGKFSLLLGASAVIACAVLYQMNALGSACFAVPASFRRPQHSRSALWALVDELRLRTGSISSAAGWEGLPELIQMIKKPSLLVIISDFFVERSLMDRALEAASTHEVIPVMVHSPFEHVLPEITDGSFSDLSSEQEHSLDASSSKTRDQYGRLLKEYEDSLRSLFLRVGISQYIHISSPETLVEDVFLGQNTGG